MARNRRADSSSTTSKNSASHSHSHSSSSMTPTPRRLTLRELQQQQQLQQASSAASSSSITDEHNKHVVRRSPKIIDARATASDMNGMENKRPLSQRVMALLGRFFIETVPAWLAVGGMLGLIFGGCCSNVFALEAIVKVEPDSGTLLTFVQFVFVAATGYFSQFDSSRPPFFLRQNRVPIRRWLVNIVLFFTINVLNNHAFSYNISVPIHIILRSGGSITTLVFGYMWGKRFSRIQVVAVTLLTVGVVIAAWSDQQSKDGAKLSEERPPFSTGLAILFLAQILSAIMGLYTEETYKHYGPHWKENLFYSHLLALPLFIPFLPAMERQFLKLAASPPLGLPKRELLSRLPVDVLSRMDKLHVPSQLAYMVINVLTQYACIRGVNLLASAASALTVTIVLNVRKLVSLLLSIWLFGNRLSAGTLIGACIVFGSGALYGLKIEGKASVAARANRDRSGSLTYERRESDGNGKIG